MSKVVIYYGDEAQSADEDGNRGIIVGRIGFASKPDERGRVESGYEIDPMHRQRGHARHVLNIMIDVAKAVRALRC
jgi:ribosomal-protein-alanine N-acetyltransferase